MKRAVCFLCCLFLAGCASQQDLHTLKTEIDTLNMRVEKLEADLVEKDRLLAQSMAQQAEQQVNYNDFFTQLQVLQGRMDELEAAGFSGSNRPPATGNILQGLNNGAAVQPAKSAYDEGLALFRSRNFSESLGLFEQYLEGNPEQSLEDNAHFWIGEALYSMERFEDAVLKYDLVIKKYPGSEKVPAAFLKQGMCFIKLGDNETGRILLQKLVKNYPDSDAASKAAKLLGED